jgi:hypothetical protein
MVNCKILQFILDVNIVLMNLVFMKTIIITKNVVNVVMIIKLFCNADLILSKMKIIKVTIRYINLYLFF